MTIAKVSKEFNISPDTLRYYERIGLIPEVHRTQNGIRDYNEYDLKCVYFAKCMRASGIPINVLVKYIKLVQKGDSTIEARKKILITERDKLADRINKMQETFDRLNKKIENYDLIFNSTNKKIGK